MCLCSVLTDGEDNGSRKAAWQTTAFLQEHSIVLDAIPLAGANDVLQAMTTATGGLSLNVSNLQQVH